VLLGDIVFLLWLKSCTFTPLHHHFTSSADECNENCYHQVRFLGSIATEIRWWPGVAGALPRTPLGEHQCLPRLLPCRDFCDFQKSVTPVSTSSYYIISSSSSWRRRKQPLRGLCIREIDVESQTLVTKYYSKLRFPMPWRSPAL